MKQRFVLQFKEAKCNTLVLTFIILE